MSLEKGFKAVEEERYSEGVEYLEAFFKGCHRDSPKYAPARVRLAIAYHGLGNTDKVLDLCNELAKNKDAEISNWAKAWLDSISSAKYIPSYFQELLAKAQETFNQQDYPETIKLLEEYCDNNSEKNSADYKKCQQLLLKAYRSDGQLDKALNLCQELESNDETAIRKSAKDTKLSLEEVLAAEEKATNNLSSFQEEEKEEEEKVSPKNKKPKLRHKAGRIAQKGVKLAMKGIASNLALASSITVSFLFGMVFVVILSLFYIIDSNHHNIGIVVAIVITIIFNLVTFFISPLIMDVIQNSFYATNWVELREIRRYSAEAAEVIERICRQKNITQPRLGIIHDENPTAFTYGSLRNQARLVVSKGLFSYLDDEEIATVYAHELGHIVHWDFAVMSVASTLIQICYLIYSFIRNLGNNFGEERLKSALNTVSLGAYLFYVVGNYLILYLSRTREYYADHFAAEMTGNPNALSRALVKIAYGIVREQETSSGQSNLVEGTRALGIYDAKASVSAGVVYQIADESQSIGKVFLWDIFNPWGWWMELNSTHPLTGKRIRALTTYAEQMGLETEFDMAKVISEGKTLSKQKLYSNFALDIILFNAQLIGVLIGLLLAIAISSIGGTIKEFFTFSLFGFGLGTLIKTAVMYPDVIKVPETDIFTLMCDPYASPLRGRQVKLTGKLIGRGDSGYKFGSNLQIQDQTGMIYTRYASRLGPLGNFLFGLTQVQELLGLSVSAVGWFRRGVAPWFDLIDLESGDTFIKSYHRFWSIIIGCGSMIVAFFLPLLLSLIKI